MRLEKIPDFVWCSMHNSSSLIISFVVVTFFTHKTFIVLFFLCVCLGVKIFFTHDD